MRAILFFLLAGLVWAVLELAFGFTLQDWLVRLLLLLNRAGI